jgi:aspartate aminotransferase
MPAISQRGRTIPASPIRKLIPYADAAKRQGVKVYHLNIGQPDLPTPQKALDALKNVTRTTLEYSPSNGYLSYRERLAAYYDRFDIQVTPDEILVTTGGSEALLLTFMACLDPGDELIMVEPGYANYLSFAVTAGITVKTVTSRIEDGFALPGAEAFEAAITPRTKAILLCNPNNPTGYFYTREELYRLRDIVLKHNLFLFSDEVYREFRYTDEPYLSALHLEGAEQQVVVIDSVSKRYSECGIRIGNIVTRNKEILSTVMKFAQARLSPPLLGQIVAEASIDGTEDYQKECYDEYLERRNFFIEGLNRIPGVFSPMPQGAFYTVVSLPVDDAEDFCKWLLTDFRYENQTVMMAPAAGFYRDPELGRNQVRMAYVLKKEDLRSALLVLEKALEAYRQR